MTIEAPTETNGAEERPTRSASHLTHAEIMRAAVFIEAHWFDRVVNNPDRDPELFARDLAEHLNRPLTRNNFQSLLDNSGRSWPEPGHVESGALRIIVQELLYLRDDREEAASQDLLALAKSLGIPEAAEFNTAGI